VDISFLEDRGTAVVHEVRGKPFKFYSATVKGAYLLKNLGKPVLQALTALFGGVGQETGVNERTVNKPNGEFMTSSEITAITPELAKLRIDTRDKAIAGLLDTLLNDKNGPIMAEIIADSLQDEFPRTKGNLPLKEVMAFWDALKLEDAVAFLVGVAKANKPVFDPLVAGLRARSLVRDSSPSASSSEAAVQAGSPAPAPAPTTEG
jgi:hypothetical protein